MLYHLWNRITDALWITDGASFCTMDQDNDGSKTKVCTDVYQGGWWYSWAVWCTEANLNGIYNHIYESDKTGIFWFQLYAHHTLKEVRMMIRKP